MRIQSQQVQIDQLTNQVDGLKIQLKEKDDQKLEAEAQLKGRGIQLAQVVEELENLKAQLGV